MNVTSLNLGPRSAVPFVPSQLPGMTMWLRADKGVTLNGSGVSAWADQSASAFVAAQATAGNQPVFTAADVNFNKQPSLTFTPASHHFLNLGTVEVFGHLPTAATIVVVHSSTEAAGTRCIVGREYNFDSWNLANDRAGTGKLEWYAHDPGTTALTNVSYLNTGKHLLAGTYQSGVATKLYLDGVAQTTTGVATGAIPNSTDQTAIGASLDTALNAAYYHQMVLVEIIAFGRALTAGELAQLHTYSQGRYGTP